MMASSFPTTVTNTTNTITNTNMNTASPATTSSNYSHHNHNKTVSEFIAANASNAAAAAAHGHTSTSFLYSSSSNPNAPGVGGHNASSNNTTNANNQQQQTATTSGGTGPTSFYNHHYQQPSGHSFLSDVNDVKDMENSLLTLLSSFHAGDLSAFGKGCSLQTMETIRAKQERLAKLHFELGSTKAGTTDSAQQNWMSDDDQNKLVAELRELSLEIEKLHETSS